MMRVIPFSIALICTDSAAEHLVLLDVCVMDRLELFPLDLI